MGLRVKNSFSPKTLKLFNLKTIKPSSPKTFQLSILPFVTSVPMGSPVTTFSRLPGWFMSNT